MRKRLAPFCFLLPLILIGCQVNVGKMPDTPTTIAVTEIHSPAIIASPVAISTSTTTPMDTPQASVTPVNTKTPTLTSTPEIPPEAKLQYKCLEVAPMGSEWVESDGVVILENAIIVNGRALPDDYLLAMSTGESTQINAEKNRGIYYTVSPDRKLMAFSSYEINAAGKIVERELVIAAADGARLKAIPWEDGWVGIPGWLNDHQLVIDLSGLDPDESYGMKAATLLALDPFTGKRQILRPDYPNIYHTRPMFYWDQWSVTMYDPTLTRVVYLTEQDEFSFVLWDIEHKQRLTSLYATLPMHGFIPIPRWSPDGSSFVVEAYVLGQDRFELFQVSRDGQQIEQLTNMYSYQKSILESVSWSPDGQTIAAWRSLVGYPEGDETELVILDLQTRQITDYCIRIKFGGKTYEGRPPAPIWSPDGKQLIVSDWYEQDHRRVILVDPAAGFAVTIAEDMEPMGWMLAP